MSDNAASNANLKSILLDLHGDRRNVASFGIVITHLLWISSVLAVVAFPTWWTVASAFIVVGLMQYRLVMSCHEAVHKTLLFPQWLNEVVGLLHCSMVGLNFIRYRRQHDEHHRAHHINHDPDAYIYEPIMRAESGWRRVCVWLFGTFSEVIEKFRQKGVAKEENPVIARTAKWHSIAVIATQLTLLTMFAATIGWWAYFVLWLAPVLTIAVLLNRTRITIEHGLTHLESGIEAYQIEDADQETIDILTNPIERFFFAPFDFNYHYAHHRIQSVPHYNNQKLSESLDSIEPGPSHRVRASYISLLIRTLWSKPCLAQTSLKLPSATTPPNFKKAA
jgi:fatty acid desaturase